MPRGRRNKSKPCVLCGKLTRDWDFICNGCRRLYHLGQEVEAARARQAPQELDIMYVAYYWALWPRLGTPDHTAHHRVKAAALELCRASEKASSRYFDGVGVGSDPKSYDRGGSTAYLCAPGTEQALSNLVQAIRDLVAHHAEAARKGAASWVRRLANGELSIADLQDKAVRDAQRARAQKD